MKKKPKRTIKPVVFIGRIKSLTPQQARETFLPLKGVDGKYRFPESTTYLAIISRYGDEPGIIRGHSDNPQIAIYQAEDYFKKLMKKVSARRNFTIKWS